MENEAIPVAEYEQLARRFTPKPNAAATRRASRSARNREPKQDQYGVGNQRERVNP